MSFFVTGVGKGKGAEFGGLEGADAHCLALAKAAGSSRTRHQKSWNSSHGSRGCSQEGMKGSGGAGLFYRFVAD